MWVSTLLSSDKDRDMSISEDECKWLFIAKICTERTWFWLWCNNAYISHYDGLSEDKKD